MEFGHFYFLSQNLLYQLNNVLIDIKVNILSNVILLKQFLTYLNRPDSAIKCNNVLFFEHLFSVKSLKVKLFVSISFNS